ncbi:GNAT family N-acetyltransferase [Subtercola sp. PAMC28395]|uniref:GNAT family N-acetyltransferase n=1 Tax=Subtercola sp. PAMC28395 TaxID=2846775 RepID=UPI001C0B0D16|nr:GNAT family N-acetyltransferase [Subtercola sp. PAMC28395]QWT25167.1 GNAT family N-acetyltransferase [Subtercola sp. PAMC28395]
MSSTDDYGFRTFPAAEADPATNTWIQAERRGFHDTRATDEQLARTADHLVTDRRQLTGAYRGDELVATFAAFESTLNVGPNTLLPVSLISNVTVRPTHRRNGILRRMMTDHLREAAAAGMAIAALTVSEATIYRRFGFGVATWVSHVALTTDTRFRMLAEPRGRCELIETADLATLGPQVFAAFHAAHPGSVDRHAATWNRVTGTATEKDDANPGIYAAAHYDEAGQVDGYVSYLFKGWDTAPHTLEVIDLVAADDNAYLGLWEFLASVDLVERIEWQAAPADDPLRWAVANWRSLALTGLEDLLWIRVLDVVAAFEARAYLGSGSVVLQVTDALGYANGTYRLAVVDGQATVTRDDSAAPDVSVEAPTLGSLYLGGVDAVTLAAAGQLVEHTPNAALRLRALLAPVASVYGSTHF